MSRGRLDGRHIAITGGAQGIGAATAKVLISLGAHVSIGDIDEVKAKATATELENGTSDRCAPFTVDVTDEESFRDFLTAAQQRFGPLDALINNAGIMSVGPFVDESPATTKRQVEINVMGVMTGTRVALEGFTERGRGHVINISSIAGRFTFAGISSYTGTKHFVFGFTEAMRAEYKGTGISFTTIMPNIAHTRLGAGVTGIKLLPKSKPDDIARAIASALVRPRPRVYIPNAIALLLAGAGLVPAVVMDWIFARLGADKALVTVDHTARVDYESDFRR